MIQVWGIGKPKPPTQGKRRIGWSTPPRFASCWNSRTTTMYWPAKRGTSRRRGWEMRSYTPIPGKSENPLAKLCDSDSTVGMIRRGFLDAESRKDLTELARDRSGAHRLAPRANALVLLDAGMSCEAIAKVLLLDDDTIRTWYRLYEEDGIEGLASFGYEGG